MLFAIVDIETTGSYADANGITEICIILHDGSRVVKEFETLVNPLQPIPRFVQSLTGITDSMVESAPEFSLLAAEVYDLLQDTIFVAHNVNFDYSFIRQQLLSCGFEIDLPKLCTVRLARQISPGLPSYSLGRLCKQIGIQVSDRHRAGGDARATVELFEWLMQKDQKGVILKSLKRRKSEVQFPLQLHSDQIQSLPETPGVYYFHDAKGRIIYVGKAVDLRQRVKSHFLHNDGTKRRQDFLREVANVSYQQCATELMAFILEAAEIKRLWPRYNVSQKKPVRTYGLYMFEDQQGLLRLAIDRKKPFLQPLYTFQLITEGQAMLRKLIMQFSLCQKLCFMQSQEIACDGLREGKCDGACEGKISTAEYNERVMRAVESLQERLPTFALVEEGRQEGEWSCILMEKGRFYGMGYVEAGNWQDDLEHLKNILTPLPDHDHIRGWIYQYAERWPEKKREL